MKFGFVGLKWVTLQVLLTTLSHTGTSEAKAVHGSIIAYFMGRLLMVLFIVYFRPKDKCTCLDEKSISVYNSLYFTHTEAQLYKPENNTNRGLI